MIPTRWDPTPKGGSDASNTDPYATKPIGRHVDRDGPHIASIGADENFYDEYPKGEKRAPAPYMMWAARRTSV